MDVGGFIIIIITRIIMFIMFIMFIISSPLKGPSRSNAQQADYDPQGRASW
jgi:hypothetical protein